MSGSFESVLGNACVHRLDLRLYSNPNEFKGNGIRIHVSSKGKIPSTGKMFLRGGSNPHRCMKPDSEPNTLPTSYSGLPTLYFICLFSRRLSFTVKVQAETEVTLNCVCYCFNSFWAI